MAQTRSIGRLLVANRGEIAIRILSAARELGIFTVAIYTRDDPSHATYGDKTVALDSPADFVDGKKIVSICREQQVDALHPGYGFLSENAEFVDLLVEAGIQFVGPTAEILRETSDKTQARSLAMRNNVPVLPASATAFSSSQEALAFVDSVRFPVMIKAVDGGGGRGIRLVERIEDFEKSFSRACGESPSRTVFIEKAAIHGFRHVEVQILGDQHGNVAHLWERECSIQRRFQKIIELAPSTIENRAVIVNVIQSALRLARGISYFSLGTFEFLVHESSGQYYFLEVNPRLQVEHTITEEISGVDIVRSQLLIAQGASIESLNLPSNNSDGSTVPRIFAMQLRVTAEDARKNFALSMGKISKVKLPGGHGVRVDTHMGNSNSTTVGASYDSLLAKIILRSSSFDAVRMKGIRALADMEIKGVQSNIPALLGVLVSEDFVRGRCSTLWLENNLEYVLKRGSETIETLTSRESQSLEVLANDADVASAELGPGAGYLFKKGDGFNIKLKEEATPETEGNKEYLLKFERIRLNDFPTGIVADIVVHSSTTSLKKTYAATISSSTQMAVQSSTHKTGNPSDTSHVCLPFSGEMVEVAIMEGDVVREGGLLCVVKQMKMELEVRSPYDAIVTWACEVEEGETVNEGLLVCILRRMEVGTKSLARPPISAKI